MCDVRQAAELGGFSMRHPNSIKLMAATRRQRPYLDFVIDGRPLAAHLCSGRNCEIDFISPFGWQGEGARKIEAEAAERLLLRAPPDLRSGRYSLLVCPECADLGCGAVTAAIERKGDLFIWRLFGFETSYGEAIDFESFSHIREFAFNRRDYSGSFRKYVTA